MINSSIEILNLTRCFQTREGSREDHNVKEKTKTDSPKPFTYDPTLPYYKNDLKKIMHENPNLQPKEVAKIYGDTQKGNTFDQNFLITTIKKIIKANSPPKPKEPSYSLKPGTIRNTLIKFIKFTKTGYETKYHSLIEIKCKLFREEGLAVTEKSIRASLNKLDLEYRSLPKGSTALKHPIFFQGGAPGSKK
ncbi:MAG: hypothetical protein V1872_08100 [bacterium]